MRAGTKKKKGIDQPVRRSARDRTPVSYAGMAATPVGADAAPRSEQAKPARTVRLKSVVKAMEVKKKKKRRRTSP